MLRHGLDCLQAAVALLSKCLTFLRSLARRLGGRIFRRLLWAAGVVASWAERTLADFPGSIWL